MSSNRGVIADTGFWIALYETRDPSQHDAARKLIERLSAGRWLFPYPLYYEVLRTRFVARQGWVEAFARELKSLHVQIVDDRPYREAALARVFGVNSGRPISLIDELIRQILASRDFRVTAVVTTNARDFQDMCRAARVEMHVI